MPERDLFFGTSGPRDAKIALVGESWGREEEMLKRPFVGGSGQELRRMLTESGLDPNAIFFTNLIAARPEANETWHFFEPAKEAALPPIRNLHPTQFARDELHRLHAQLEAVKPALIICAGNWPLWALTHCSGFHTSQETGGRRVPNGIEKWRGSMWYADAATGATTKLLPIIHPAAILREWYKRAVTIHDLRERVPMALADNWRPKPTPTFDVTLSFEETKKLLECWLSQAERKKFRLVNDIENTMTPPRLLTCIGLAASKHHALVIPLVVPDGKQIRDYWPAEQELELMRLLRQLLMHPNVLVEGQNYLHDTQFLIRYLACRPRLDFDTMLAQHLLFPGVPKDLSYLSSLYCTYHWYWKEDAKEWDLRGDLTEHLRYNAMDCVRQFECGTILRQLLVDMNQDHLWAEELEKNELALDMMLRGVKIDTRHRSQLAIELAAKADEIGRWLHSIIPQHLSETTNTKNPTPWFNSAIQTRNLFADQLGFKLPRNRKTGNPTMGKEAIRTLGERHPEFARIFEALGDLRSVNVFHKTFVRAPLDIDDRMRCMFNVGGPETFRWSSSENAFGSGTNLQNIPEGTEE